MSGITTEGAVSVGYERGDRVQKVTMGTTPNFVVTYWECVEAHGVGLNPNTW